MDLTRDSSHTVIERIQRDTKFAQSLLRESMLQLLNQHIEDARPNLRDLVKGTAKLEALATALGKSSQDIQVLLETTGAGDIEDLNAIHDELWEHINANNTTLGLVERRNPRKFYKKICENPDEGCITAMSPEIYKEIYGDKR